MSIKHVAAAILTPAAIAGVALSTGTAASAAAVHHGAQHLRHDRYHWVTVRLGGTLSGIAAAHHISWEALYATPPNYHRVTDPNVITIGQHLRLPKDPGLRAAQFPALEAKLQATVAAAQAPAASGQAQVPAPQPAESQPTSDQQPAGQPAPDQQAPAQQAPAQQPADQAPSGQQSPASGPAGPGGSLTSGMSSFERCVAFRESTDTPTDPDGLFGILPSTWASLGYSGTAGQASVGQQKTAFNHLYAAQGAAPWAPYDGC